jgi:hypothetical protein
VKTGCILTIPYLKSEEHIITCGWLLSEVIRRMVSFKLPTELVAGLETKEQDLFMDY